MFNQSERKEGIEDRITKFVELMNVGRTGEDVIIIGKGGRCWVHLFIHNGNYSYCWVDAKTGELIAGNYKNHGPKWGSTRHPNVFDPDYGVSGAGRSGTLYQAQWKEVLRKRGEIK